MNRIAEIKALYEKAMDLEEDCAARFKDFATLAFEAWPLFERLYETMKAFDSQVTISMDLTRSPGSQKVFEVDESLVRDVERALAAFDRGEGCP